MHETIKIRVSNHKKITYIFYLIRKRFQNKKRDAESYTSFFASRFFTSIMKVQFIGRIIEYPVHQKPDRPYFPLKVILYNVRH